jgi:hypothetical protein
MRRKELTPTNSQKIYIWKILVARTNPSIEKLKRERNE